MTCSRELLTEYSLGSKVDFLAGNKEQRQNMLVTTYQISVDIDAPADRVWEVMIDVERWHEWTASITSIQLETPGPLRIGSRARIKQPKFPPATWEVTKVEPGKSFTWVSKAPGMAVSGTHIVTPKGRSSEATLILEFEGRIGQMFGKLTRSINEHYIALESAGLKKRSEHPPATARLK